MYTADGTNCVICIMSSRKNCWTGKARPGTSSTGQLLKYSEKSVVPMVADIKMTKEKNYNQPLIIKQIR